MVHIPRFFMKPEMTTRSGIAGMTRKTLMKKLITSSTSPPLYAAVTPSVAARPVASTAAAKPSSSERRAPSTTCEKMSLPWSVVPKRWFHEGACRAASRLKSFGCATEISGAISAITTMNPTIAMPVADLRLREQEQPAGDAQPAVDALRRSGEPEVEGRIELGHQSVRSRGSRMRLTTSINRFARITQIDSTTRIACASG